MGSHVLGVAALRSRARAHLEGRRVRLTAASRLAAVRTFMLNVSPLDVSTSSWWTVCLVKKMVSSERKRHAMTTLHTTVMTPPDMVLE